MKQVSCLFLFVLFLFAVPSYVSAANITLENGKTSLSSPDEEYEIDVSVTINANDSAIYFLRGVFSKADSNNYCGYTWNNTTWFSGPYSSNEGWKNFLSISIKDNVWKGKLKAKIDTTKQGCQESGEYTFKIQRFTNSGSGNFDDQNIQTVSFIIPTPTLTQPPTPTLTKVPSPTKAPTATKSPTATKTPTVTLKNGSELKVPTSIPTKMSVLAADTKREELDDESASDAAIPSPILKASPSATKKEEKKKEVLVQGATTNYLFGGSVIVGGLFLGACGILIFVRNRRKNDYE